MGIYCTILFGKSDVISLLMLDIFLKCMQEVRKIKHTELNWALNQHIIVYVHTCISVIQNGIMNRV